MNSYKNKNHNNNINNNNSYNKTTSRKFDWDIIVISLVLYFSPISGYFEKKDILTFLLTSKYFHRPKWLENQKGDFLSITLPFQGGPRFTPHLGSLLTLQVSGMLLRNDPRE